MGPMGLHGLGGRVLTPWPCLQMAYQAWVTNAQTVLRRRRQEQAQLPVGESGPEGGGEGNTGLSVADHHPYAQEAA